ncbi:MAG: translocation/assembly module TamB domain-containing protein [Pseudomonadota bacterium]
MAADKPDTAPPTPATRRRRGLWLGGSVAAVSVLTVLALATGLYSLGTVGGTAWWLARLPGVAVAAAKGPLLGDFSADQVTVQLPGNGAKLQLDGLTWHGLRLSWSSTPGAWVDVVAESLSVARLVVTPGQAAPAPAPTSALQAPKHLRLPLTLRINAIDVAELQLPGLETQPLRDLQARIGVGADTGRHHRIDLQQLDWDRFRLSGHAEVATGGDMPVDARLDLTQPSPADAASRLPTLQGQLTLAGPLAQLALAAKLSTVQPKQPSAKAALTPPAELSANAVLQPFAPWPVSTLAARWQAIDLSAFTAAAPRTQLAGNAQVSSPARDQPATVQLALTNPTAGRWSDGQLPLRQLKLALQTPPDQPQFATLTQLDAELGSAQQAAGHLRATGQNRADGWALNTVLDTLQPAGLDARAPAMQLSGPVTLRGQGTATVDLTTDLRGLVPAQKTPVQLQLNAQSTTAPEGGLRVALQRALLQAGAAQATLNGELQRANANAPLQVKGQAQLQAFDPLLWWPGGAPAAARQGRTQLNANATVDLSMAAAPTPDNTTPSAPATWQTTLARLSGQVQATLRNSRLADVPVEGELALQQSATAPAHATAQLQLAGNRLNAEASLSPAKGPAAYQADVTVDAPTLQRLQPLMALLPTEPRTSTANGKPAPLRIAGAVQGKAKLQGQDAVLTSQGQLAVRGLVAGPAQLQQADLNWQLGTALDAPMQLQAKLSQLVLPGPSLDSLQLALDGTARAHTLNLLADARLPATTATGAATAPARKANAVLKLQGGLGQATGAAPSLLATAWRGTLQQLALSDPAKPGAPWLATRDVVLALQWAEALHSVEAQPGQIDFRVGTTASALRWRTALWQQTLGADGTAGSTRYDVQGTLDPLVVAPLLAELQPDFGWGGDLVVGGRIALKSDPSPVADVVLERLRGDLQISDETDTQALGLTDLRLALSANNGVWNFTQALAGESVGVAVGAFTARTRPGEAFPNADTPLQGVLELQVKNLASLATWVPPGWRLGGALQSSASLAGKLGAPEFTGQLQGQKLSVRNVLQGVNVTDGDVAISLRGETARIERFSARAGNGTLRLSGDAALGAVPSANVQVVADKFQVLGRVDQRVVASGQAQLRLAANRVALDGQFTVDEGLFDFTRSDAPTLASDVVVKRAPNQPGTTPPAPKPAAPSAAQRVLVLNLGIGLGEQLRLKGRGLSTRLQGDLRLTSPGGKLALIGAVRTVGGNYDAYGQKLSIDRGVVTFIGPIENPRLDIEATRPKTDIRVGVTVSGTAQNPRVRLFSEPDLPDVDKLSWLVLGRASSGLGRTDTALLQRAAVALFAGEEEGAVTKLTRSIGLDEISLRQTDGEVRETVVTLGKQLSERLYVGYERGLNSTAGNFQLLYRIAQRFTLRGQTGLDNAVDFIFTWRWQ